MNYSFKLHLFIDILFSKLDFILIRKVYLFIYLFAVQSWASFWLFTFPGTVSDVTEIEQPGSPFAFSHPKPSLCAICRLNSPRAMGSFMKHHAIPVLFTSPSVFFFQALYQCSDLFSMLCFGRKMPGFCIDHARIFLMTRFRILFQETCSQGLFLF